MRRPAALLALLLLALILCALLLWHVMPGDDAHTCAPGAVAAAASDQDVATEAPAGAPPRARAPRVREHAATPPRARPAARTPDTPEMTTFTVRVLDERGTPVPGVPVDLTTDLGNDPGTRTTTSRGSVTWEIPARVWRLTATSPLFDAVRLDEPETVVRLGDLLPLEILFTDQETRRPLEVRVLGSPLAPDDVQSPLRTSVYTPDVAPIRAGREADLRIWFEPPDGYVIRRGHPVRRRGLVSRYATAVRTTIPVAREIALRARVLRHDGSPAESATATATVTGAHPASASASASAAGEATITGLPFLRGEHLTIHAGDAAGRRSPTADVVLVDADRELRVTVRLPERPTVSWGGDGGRSGGRYSDRRSGAAEDPGAARLTISVARRNGLPAVGARVLLRGPVRRDEHADASGQVHFELLPAGTYTVILREPGLAATTAEVEVADGEARTMALREATGRDATVRVLGADGLPLPNVSVRVELPWGESHVQLDGGVQELGRLTDLAGRVRLTGLPDAAVTVVATLGSRSVRAKLDGESLSITLPNG